MTQRHLKVQPRMALLATFPDLPRGPQLEEGVLASVIESFAPGLTLNGRRILLKNAGRWKILTDATDEDGYESAIMVPSQQALKQWKRAGIGERFPGSLLIGAQLDRLYGIFRATVKAVPERQAIARRLCDYAEWREREKPLWDAGKHLDDKLRWASWYSAAANEIPDHSCVLGEILADSMESEAVRNEDQSLLARITVHQVALFAYTLKLEGQQLGVQDKYPGITEQRALMNAAWNAKTLSPDIAQAFARTQLAGYPAVSDAIVRHASLLRDLIRGSASHQMHQANQQKIQGGV